MTWTPRSISPSASPCCITARLSSKARAQKWSPIRERARCTLATKLETELAPESASGPATAAEALALADVDALYGESHVLHGVSFTLHPGRVLALLGRNGAGKTTCMNVIVGFLSPRAGDIRLSGDSITRLAPGLIARQGISILPQGRGVFPTLTVREHLLVARQMRHDGARAWTMERVFALFPALQARQRQPAGTPSGGEAQKLASWP